jgi:3-oxoacyl-[acyl-carrier protein] reductase
MNKPMNKRTAIVTGSSSGIGLAIAERLLTEGWKVMGLDQAPAVIANLSFEGFAVDLSKGIEISSCLARIEDYLNVSASVPEAIIHAAGFMQAGPMETSPLNDGEAMWLVHVASITQIVQKLLPQMRAVKSGRVVLIGSRVARGIANRSQYAASKAALVSLARSWAAEVVSHGITVNVVSPAATQTAMLSDQQRLNVPPKVPPIGRLIRVEEIAATISYLLSSNAAAITGQNIQICGGASLDF